MRQSVRRLGLGAGVLGLLLGLGWALGSLLSGKAPAASEPVPPESSTWSAQALAAAPGEHGTQTLGGRVLGPQGPLAGALVVALAPPSAGWRARSFIPARVWEGCSQGPDVARLGEWVEAHRGEGLPLARATTDAQGRFLLEGLAPGAVVLWAEKGQWVGLREGVSIGPEEEDVRVGLGKVLSGDVHDGRRQPLTGVRVTTWVPTAGRVLEALTDAQGHFALGPLPGHDEPLLLSREGFLTQWIAPPPVKGWWSPLSLLLPMAYPVSGRVLDERGPVAGATVRSESLPDAEAELTDEQGRFSLQDLCVTSSVLVARQGERIARQRMDWSAPGEHAPVELFLSSGVRLSGRVRDTSGHALAQAEVTVSGQERLGQTLGVKTDTQGRFLFEPLVPGRYGVSARAAYYSVQRIPPRLLTSSQEVEFELQPTGQVEGVLVDEGGTPVEQAQLRVMNARGRALGESQVSSGEGGHFTLEAPPPEGWRLVIQHPEFMREEVALPASVRDVRVVLRRGASLEVEVVDESGRPVEHAVVALSRGQRGTTDARGRVTFRALGPVTYTVLACGVDTGLIASQQQTLTAHDSRTVRLVLRLSEGRLSGRAVDGRGAPVQGVSLLFGPEGLPRETGCSTPLEARPGPDGSFSMEHLAEGTWTLETPAGFDLDVPASRGVESWGGRGHRVKVSSAGTQIQLVLRSRSEHPLRGRIVREDGTPVTLFQLNGEEVSQPEGRFSLSEPPGGHPTQLRVEAPGLVPRVVQTLVPSGGQQVDLGDVVLQRSVSLTGTVVDALSSAPVSQVQVGFKDKNARSYLYPAVYTRPEGHFTLEGVPAEEGTLVLTHPLYPSPQFVPVTGGQQEGVVRLAPGATLEGSVEMNGSPVPAGTVQLSSSQGGLGVATEFVKGHYLLELIPAGHYEGRVQGPRGEGPAVLVSLFSVDLAAGEHKTLDFTGLTTRASVDVLVSGKDIEVHLVPGELPLIGPRQGLYNRLLAGFMGKRVSDGVRHFSQLPMGNYTLIAIRHDDQGTDVHRELVELPSEGELSFTLTPLWNRFED